MKNKVIIFDWGGVIENNNPEGYIAKDVVIDIIRKYGCTFSENKILEICDTARKLYNTFVSDEENIVIKWFEEIKKNLDIDCTYDEYKNDYYKDVVKYIHSLKKKSKIAIFSSLVKLDSKRINDQVDLSKFDYVFLTYEMGYDKPNKNAFDMIEKKVQIQPKNILFIDDNEVNIKVAQNMGWNTCQATGNELDKIKKVVEQFLSERL